ncbi:MAG: aspartyl/asparaginyl beta-hydroxylase domain-containing protein [Proteobacteria bacterium]|nr:aspartyl/asparaginyl beta-hydroxylase domain-containing protein [Pseudomonadota bacterium]
MGTESDVRRSGRSRVLRAGKKARPWINGVIARHSPLGDPPVYDPALFPFVKPIEAEWRAIRAEADAILEQQSRLAAVVDISPDHARIANSGRGWKSYFLYGYGHRMEAACRRCPRSAALLTSIPGLETGFFSILEPGQRLVPHRGPTKAILTWHLALRTPTRFEDCSIEIDRRVHTWREGQSLIFDDTYRHAVWNDTSEPRVVLLIHFRRPVTGLGGPVARSFLRAIKWSPFVRDAKRNHEAWEADFEARLSGFHAERPQ